MKFVFKTCLFFLFLTLAGIHAAQGSVSGNRDERAASHLVLTVISGLRLDDFNRRDQIGFKIPALAGLMSSGSYAVSIDGVYPSTLLPSAATIATGALPADHGVISDAIEPAVIQTDTLWDAAKRAGLTVASFGFPLSADNTPESVPSGNKTYPDGLKQIASALESDARRTDAMLRSIEKGLPNLTLLHYGSFEAAQRRFGIRSRQARTVIEGIDSDLGRIFDAIRKTPLSGQVTFIVVSDHGAMAVESVFKPNVILERAGWLKTDSRGRITEWRAIAECFEGSASIRVRDKQDIPEASKLFDEYKSKSSSPVWSMLKTAEIARIGADPRAALYLDGSPGFAMSPEATGSSTGSANVRAAAGYLPSRSEMRGILLISGKGVRSGTKIEYARLIDIAPTVSRLLGLEMKPARGRVLTEVIN